MEGNRDLDRARIKLAEVEQQVREVILILTAEQAIKAQRVIREAGRRHRGQR